MALCPFAEHKLLPENYTQGRISPRAVVFHSAGGESELYGWWQSDESRGLESHFWVGRDGRTVQYMDTTVRADANGDANRFAVSIETASTTHASEPWDPPQLRALIRLTDWLCDVHPIPARLMGHPTDSGLAWHVQFGAPGPWTPSRGKVCPGGARIEQVKHQIVPAVAGQTAVHQEDDDMTEAERKMLRDALAEAKQANLRAQRAVDILEGRGYDPRDVNKNVPAKGTMVARIVNAMYRNDRSNERTEALISGLSSEGEG